jgi:hypothetical protein
VCPPAERRRLVEHVRELAQQRGRDAAGGVVDVEVGGERCAAVGPQPREQRGVRVGGEEPARLLAPTETALARRLRLAVRLARAPRRDEEREGAPVLRRRGEETAWRLRPMGRRRMGRRGSGVQGKGVAEGMGSLEVEGSRLAGSRGVRVVGEG